MVNGWSAYKARKATAYLYYLDEKRYTPGYVIGDRRNNARRTMIINENKDWKRYGCPYHLKTPWECRDRRNKWILCGKSFSVECID